MQDILNIGKEEDIESDDQGAEPVLKSRLKYGTGMRINAALKVLAEKRQRRLQRKQEVGYTIKAQKSRSNSVKGGIALCLYSLQVEA